MEFICYHKAILNDCEKTRLRSVQNVTRHFIDGGYFDSRSIPGFDLDGFVVSESPDGIHFVIYGGPNHLGKVRFDSKKSIKEYLASPDALISAETV